MNTEDLVFFLSRRVPELTSVINDEVDRLRKDFGSDVPISDYVLGIVLVPLVSRMLKDDDQRNQSTLFALFAVIDELLDDPNPNMVDVVFTSFFEMLSQDRSAWEKARIYMSERLQQMTRSS